MKKALKIIGWIILSLIVLLVAAWLLACDITNRYVTCLPADSLD